MIGFGFAAQTLSAASAQRAARVSCIGARMHVVCPSFRAQPCPRKLVRCTQARKTCTDADTNKIKAGPSPAKKARTAAADAGKTPSAQDLVASSAVHHTLAWMTEVVSTLGDDLLPLATESAGEFGGSSAFCPRGYTRATSEHSEYEFKHGDRLFSSSARKPCSQTELQQK